MSFTVEFAPPNVQPPTKVEQSLPTTTTSSSTSAPQKIGGDDGFASGFNNPNWRPQKQEVYVNAHLDNSGTVPTAVSAQPVYPK